MIIFDLSALAADSHRRHFIDYGFRNDIFLWISDHNTENYVYKDGYENYETRKIWHPDYASYNAECDRDEPVEPVIEMLDGIYFNSKDESFFLGNVQIWTNRCESLRKKTLEWLDPNVVFDGITEKMTLKMRPIGDDSPQEELFEKWLCENANLPLSHVEYSGALNNIEIVFSSHKPTIDLFRRRGVFVFDCNQGDS